MSIKMIVCDMDGTLLDADHEIQPKTHKKLIELQQKGIILVLASGRSYMRLLPDARKLQLDQYNGFLIDVNGSSIYHVASEERHRIGHLAKENIRELNEYFNHFNVELQYYLDDTIYTYLTDSLYELKKNIRGEMNLPADYPWMSGMHSWFADYREGYKQFLIRDFKEAPKQCNKMIFAQEPFYLDVVRDTIANSPLSEKYEIVAPDQRRVEVTKKGINKGNALALLAEELNIQKNEIIIFGDSENDLSMFYDKKYTVAMANGLESAKTAANFLTESNNNEGIYKMLVHFENEGIL